MNPNQLHYRATTPAIEGEGVVDLVLATQGGLMRYAPLTRLQALNLIRDVGSFLASEELRLRDQAKRQKQREEAARQVEKAAEDEKLAWERGEGK